MDYYKDLERRMEEATVKINKASARAKILVHQLTDFKLNKNFLRKMLHNEFERRNLNSSELGERAANRLNIIKNTENQNGKKLKYLLYCFELNFNSEFALIDYFFVFMNCAIEDSS